MLYLFCLYGFIGILIGFIRNNHHSQWHKVVTKNEVPPANLNIIVIITSIGEGAMWPRTLYEYCTNKDLRVSDPNQWTPETKNDMREYILFVNNFLETIMK